MTDTMEFKGPKFGIVPPEIFQDGRMGTPARAGLAYLFTFRNTETGIAFPGQARIAEEMHVTTRTVKRWVQEWLDNDWVRIERRKTEGKKNRNIYHVEWVSPSFEPNKVTKMSPSRGQKCHPNIEGNKEELSTASDFEEIFGEADQDGEWKEITSVAVNDEVHDIQKFPIHVRGWIKAICELWKITPPKSKSEIKDWSIGCESLKDACGEFGTDLLLPIFQDWDHDRERNQKRGAPHWWVTRPGSLVKVARAKAGELRLTDSGTDDTVSHQDPF